jgi:hypothetical protein
MRPQRPNALTPSYLIETLSLVVLVLLLSLARLAPHVANMAPVAAAALFAGAVFRNRSLALLVPVLGMFLSDVLLYTMQGVPFVNPNDTYALGKIVDYAALALPVWFGMRLQKNRPASKVFGFALAGSFSFFVLSNLGVFLFGGLYPFTLASLVECYVLAVPFYKNTLAGDLLYTVLIFGSWYLVERNKNSLNPSAA